MNSESKRAAQNPYGIHFQKASLILVLFFIHAEAWINTAAKQQVNIADTLFWRVLLFFGTFNFLVPNTSGAMLRLAGSFEYRGWRLRPFAWRPIVYLCFGLSLLESCKAALGVSFEEFFGWDVLHLIAVSTLVILLMARISILAVWASALATVALTPWMRTVLQPMQIVDRNRIELLNQLQVGSVFLYASALALFLGSVVALYRTTRFQRKYKLRILLLLIVAYNLTTFLVYRYEVPYYFVARLINLPIGILTGDKLGLHWWPIFPWYAPIAFGFCTYDLFARYRSGWLRLVMFSAAVLYTAYYYIFDFREVVREYDHMTGWSSLLFQGNMGLLYLSIAMFAGNAVVWDAVCKLRAFNRFLDRVPGFYEYAYMFSRTILLSYLFINILGPVLAYPFAHFLPLPVALVAGPLFDILLWAYLGRKLMRVLDTKGLRVSLSKSSTS